MPNTSQNKPPRKTHHHEGNNSIRFQCTACAGTATYFIPSSQDSKYPTPLQYRITFKGPTCSMNDLPFSASVIPGMQSTLYRIEDGLLLLYTRVHLFLFVWSFFLGFGSGGISSDFCFSAELCLSHREVDIFSLFGQGQSILFSAHITAARCGRTDLGLSLRGVWDSFLTFCNSL